MNERVLPMARRERIFTIIIRCHSDELSSFTVPLTVVKILPYGWMNRCFARWRTFPESSIGHALCGISHAMGFCFTALAIVDDFRVCLRVASSRQNFREREREFHSSGHSLIQFEFLQKENSFPLHGLPPHELDATVCYSYIRLWWVYGIHLIQCQNYRKHETRLLYGELRRSKSTGFTQITAIFKRNLRQRIDFKVTKRKIMTFLFDIVKAATQTIKTKQSSTGWRIHLAFDISCNQTLTAITKIIACVIEFAIANMAVHCLNTYNPILRAND